MPTPRTANRFTRTVSTWARTLSTLGQIPKQPAGRGLRRVIVHLSCPLHQLVLVLVRVSRERDVLLSMQCRQPLCKHLVDTLVGITAQHKTPRSFGKLHAVNHSPASSSLDRLEVRRLRSPGTLRFCGRGYRHNPLTPERVQGGLSRRSRCALPQAPQWSSGY